MFPGFATIAEVDLLGRTAEYALFFHPAVRSFWSN